MKVANVFNKELFTYCILPRLLNSPSDAIYCARFIHKLFELEAPGFNVLFLFRTVSLFGCVKEIMTVHPVCVNIYVYMLFTQIFNECGYLVSCCTPREAAQLGIFFSEIYILMEQWRVSYAHHKFDMYWLHRKLKRNFLHL